MADRKVTIGLFGDDRDLDQKIADAKKKIDDLKAKKAEMKLGADSRAFDLEIRKAELKLEELNRKSAKPNIDTMKARIELDKLDASIDHTELKLDTLAMKGAPAASEGIAAFGSKLGALSNYGMPALIAGLVMLGGQLVTVGFGLAAFGAAAIKDVAPILHAAQATGGLSANLDKLDPTQRKLAISLLGLGRDYDKFAASVKPEVFSVFNKGLVLADGLLKDTGGIAQAAGKGLASVLGSIDNEFQSGEWQKFFGYIEQNAGPDIEQLGHLFTDLLGAIPPLTEALHPLGAALITDLDDVVKFTGGLSEAIAQVEKVGLAAAHVRAGNNPDSTGNRAIANVKHVISQVLNPVQAALDLAGKAGGWVEHLFGGSDKASAAQQRLAQATRAAALAAQNEQKNMNSLASSIDSVINKTLALQGDDVSWHQAMQAATQAINANKNSLDGNSKSALAAKQAIIASTQAALSLADKQLTLSHNTQGASDTLNRQIQYLANHAGHSKFAAAEVQALIAAEFRIPHNIQSTIHAKTAAAAAAIANIMNRMAQLNGMTSTVYVNYSVGGQSYVVPHHRHVGSNAKGTPSAAPGWSWVGEKGPELIKMKGGEQVIPSHISMGMVKAGAVPGYADGAGFSFPNFSMPNITVPAMASQQTIVLEWAGGNASNDFMSWLSNNIRARGGSPNVLTKKVKFA